jgi:hypothetical protein
MRLQCCILLHDADTNITVMFHVAVFGASKPALWTGLSVAILAAATGIAVITPDVGIVVSLGKHCTL